MNSFILIIVLGGFGGSAISSDHIEFSSAAACAAAEKKLRGAEIPTHFKRTKAQYLCVRK